MVRVLVTGGAGFIGKHLVRALLEKDHTVTIFDNFSNSSKKSISHLIDIGAKVIEGDITRPDEILDAIKEQDIVIHLAAKISVQESISNPIETFRVNVEGTRNVLNSCKKHGVKKIIVASSAAVYGEGVRDVKLTEESKTNPISPYGESKLKTEQTVKEFCLEHSIGFVILRFFNIYGEGQTDEYAGVITKFVKRIRENKSITVFGDGLQTRDFVAIEDVIDSILNAMSSVKNGVYNIASGKAVTIKKLAEEMILSSTKKLDIKYDSKKEGEIRYSQADITLARKELKYSPKFEINKIIVKS